MWFRRSVSCPPREPSRPILRRLHSSNDLTDALQLIDLVDVKDGQHSLQAPAEERARPRHSRTFSLIKRKNRGSENRTERLRMRKRPKSEYGESEDFGI